MPPPAAAPEGTERQPLSWLGCGCAALMTVIMLGVVTVAVTTWRASERFEEALADPAARAAAARRVLPHAAPPVGYHPVGGIEMPLGMLRMAVFADRQPGAGGSVESGFFYVSMPDWLGRREKFRQVFEGDAGPVGGIAQDEVEFEAREEIGRGELAAGGARVLYYARRGELSVDPARFGTGGEEGGEAADAGDEGASDGERTAGAEVAAPADTRHRFDGIATMLFFDCPDDDRLRVGLWFAPDPVPDTPLPAADLTGTPGDPAALAEFLAGFALCSE